MREDISVEELVSDDSFCNFCFQNNEADVLYWKQYARLYPSQKEKIDNARKIVLALHLVTGESARRVDGIRKWVVPVAASLAVLLITAYFYFSRQDTLRGLASAPVLPADVAAPRSSKAVIVLPNGEKMYLDSTMAAARGSLRLLKLSANAVVYQPANKQAADKDEYHKLINPNGSSVVHIQLADGTHAWLNAGTSLVYPVAFLENERKVTVTGEAYFEVAHHANQPFIVNHGNTNIQVLGTHFNVNAYNDEKEIKVTLLQGLVKVKGERDSALLKPGQQAGIAGVIQVRKNVDLDAVMAWKNGYFNFKDASLQDVLRQLARWYDLEVIYTGAIPSRKFAGEMGRDLNLSQVLGILQQNNVHFSIQGRKIIVLP